MVTLNKVVVGVTELRHLFRIMNMKSGDPIGKRLSEEAGSFHGDHAFGKSQEPFHNPLGASQVESETSRE